MTETLEQGEEEGFIKEDIDSAIIAKYNSIWSKGLLLTWATEQTLDPNKTINDHFEFLWKSISTEDY